MLCTDNKLFFAPSHIANLLAAIYIVKRMSCTDVEFTIISSILEIARLPASGGNRFRPATAGR